MKATALWILAVWLLGPTREALADDASRATFTLNGRPESTILFLALDDEALGVFEGLAIRGDGRVFLTRTAKSAAREEGPHESSSLETWVDSEELTAIFRQAVEDGVADMDTGMSGLHRLTGPIGQRQRAQVILQFEALRTSETSCRQCERWLRIADVAEILRRFPQVREFMGLQRLFANLAELWHRPPRSTPAVLPRLDLAADPNRVILEVLPTGSPSASSTGRRFSYRLYGDGRVVRESGPLPPPTPADRVERRLAPADFRALRQEILDPSLVGCDQTCLQAKILEAQMGQRILPNHGWRVTFRFFYQDVDRGEQVTREITLDDLSFSAKRFPQLGELQRLVAIFHRLFGAVEAGLTPKQKARRDQAKRSAR